MGSPVEIVTPSGAIGRGVPRQVPEVKPRCLARLVPLKKKSGPIWKPARVIILIASFVSGFGSPVPVGNSTSCTAGVRETEAITHFPSGDRRESPTLPEAERGRAVCFSKIGGIVHPASISADPEEECLSVI